MKWVNILPGNSKTDPLSTQNFQLKFKKKKHYILKTYNLLNNIQKKDKTEC